MLGNVFRRWIKKIFLEILLLRDVDCINILGSCILIFGIFFVKFGFTCFQNNQLSIVFFFSRKPMILNNRVWYVKSKYQTKHEMINRHDIRYQCVKYFLLSHYKLDVLSSSIFQSIKQGPIRQYINK